MTGLWNMKVATGRALICIHDAGRPLSMGELTEMIGRKYDKVHDLSTMQYSIDFLTERRLIDSELRLTPHGREGYELLRMNEAGWAAKFFRKSNSPNVGQRARPAPEQASLWRHSPNSGLMVMR